MDFVKLGIVVKIFNWILILCLAIYLVTSVDEIGSQEVQQLFFFDPSIKSLQVAVPNMNLYMIIKMPKKQARDLKNPQLDDFLEGI